MTKPAPHPLDRLRIERGDLAAYDVDAVVNAANPRLAGGGGVDGAIHRVAGPGLLEECRRLHPKGCPPGEVRLTGGHGLKARHVLHAVGPVWRGGGHGEARLLASCYRKACERAAAEGFESLAFPAISTGVYGYPPREAAEVTLDALEESLARFPGLRRVHLVLFTEELHACFLAAWKKRRGE